LFLFAQIYIIGNTDARGGRMAEENIKGDPSSFAGAAAGKRIAPQVNIRLSE
jgi:hypothetical protein